MVARAWFEAVTAGHDDRARRFGLDGADLDSLRAAEIGPTFRLNGASRAAETGLACVEGWVADRRSLALQVVDEGGAKVAAWRLDATCGGPWWRHR